MRLAITVERSDGGVVDIEVLRPRAWVEQQGITSGSLLPLKMAELVVDGYAFVHSINPCPKIAPGPGNHAQTAVNFLVDGKPETH